MIGWIVSWVTPWIVRFLLPRFGPERTDRVIGSRVFGWAVAGLFFIVAAFGLWAVARVLGYGHDRSYAVAQCNAKIAAETNRWNERIRLETEAANRRIRAAEEKARAEVTADLEQAVERAAELEQALARVESDPVVIPRDLVRELRK